MICVSAGRIPTIVSALLIIMMLTSPAMGQSSPGTEVTLLGVASAAAYGGGPSAMRRLTESQYRNTIRDIFGDDIAVIGRFEPDNRREGLLSVGSSWVSVSPAGLEQYSQMATNIAQQILSGENSAEFLNCQLSESTEMNEACAAQFISVWGRQLFRRDLLPSEVDSRVKIAARTTAISGDFHTGLQYALASLMVSPEFLFRVERVEDGTLDSVSRATKLSYLLWNTTPDEELLEAGIRGDLLDRELLEEQVNRLLDSPRLADGVRAMFSDMLGFDSFDSLDKDPAIYPLFTATLAADAKEQTLRVIVDHVVTRNADYRELFTTRKTFVSRPLGVLQRVPVVSETGWEAVELRESSKRAGILTHPSLLMLHSHPGRSSPTLRGKFIRETFLCQHVPAPPADVDFAASAEDEKVLRTARERLERHRTDPSCTGCHLMMDGLGLALERFDGVGMFRTTENGAVIDPSGSLDMNAFFDDAPGLGAALAQSRALGSCLVDTLFRYANGRKPAPGEEAFIDQLESGFRASEHRLRDLLTELVQSEAFFAVSQKRAVEFEE